MEIKLGKVRSAASKLFFSVVLELTASGTEHIYNVQYAKVVLVFGKLKAFY